MFYACAQACACDRTPHMPKPDYNASVVKASKFPSILTLADIMPVFKKGDKECKNNYDQ